MIDSGTDRREQVEMLHELYTVSEANNLGVGIAVKVKFCIISAIFDYNPKICDAMKAEHWEKLLQCISELLTLINSRTDIIMGEHVSVKTHLICLEFHPDLTYYYYHLFLNRRTMKG